MGSPQPAPQPDGGPARTGAEPPGPRRLRRRILLLALVPLLAAVLLIALAVRQQTADLSRREHALVESAYMAAKEVELRNHVDIAMSALQPLYDTGRDDPQIKAEAIRLLNSIRYGSSAGDGYFFAYDFEGRCLVLPHQPELVGSNLWDVRDRDGRYVVQALVARAREGQGYFRYVWNKPSLRQVAPKLGYVVGLPRWQWMVGTGLYLDDIQATLDALDRQGREHIWTTLLWIGGISLLALSLVAGSALALNLSEYRAADAQLQSMARQVVQSQEYERAHLSRELHDSTGQTLVSIKLLLESATSQLGPQGAPPALLRAVQRLGDALHQVRRISHRLRPAELDTLGLPAALDDLAAEFDQHGRVRVALQLWGEAPMLPDEVNTVLFRVVQESLTNIEKHAGATRVGIRLIFHAGGLRLRIVDDGIGFDVPAIRVDPRRGIGMRNMRERVESIGGSFSIASRPGRTAVLADLPEAAIEGLREPPAEAA